MKNAGTDTITGQMLLKAGMTQGRHMKEALKAANIGIAYGMTKEQAIDTAMKYQPAPKVGLKTEEAPFRVFMEPEAAEEWSNMAAVERDMRALMRCPTVTRGAVMPDACPAGTISVGGVVETKNAIHPGFHSADICCSVMATFTDADPSALLDAAHCVTHFGGGGRKSPVGMGEELERHFLNNPFLKGLEGDGHSHFATQGDGNHFLFVGRSRETGQTVLVTHHGSRRPGAMLYKRGMETAKRQTRERANGVPEGMSWIDATTDEGKAYWEALQTIREWTKKSHQYIHNATVLAVRAKVFDQFWNEHNFVFQRQSGRFLHGKGATPAWTGFAKDSDSFGRVLIPLNMAQPVLVARGLDNPDALGFCPHGAGRNVSRSAHMKNFGAEMGETELAELRASGLDVRFWFDSPDASELPSAYKNAESVRRQTEGFGLAEVVDEIVPHGSIMAGNWMSRNL